LLHYLKFISYNPPKKKLATNTRIFFMQIIKILIIEKFKISQIKLKPCFRNVAIIVFKIKKVNKKFKMSAL